MLEWNLPVFLLINSGALPAALRRCMPEAVPRHPVLVVSGYAAQLAAWLAALHPAAPSSLPSPVVGDIADALRG